MEQKHLKSETVAFNISQKENFLHLNFPTLSFLTASVIMAYGTWNINGLTLIHNYLFLSCDERCALFYNDIVTGNKKVL